MANKITPKTFHTLASLEIVHPTIRSAVLDVLTVHWHTLNTSDRTRQFIAWAKKVYQSLSEVIREVKAARFEGPSEVIKDCVTHNATKQQLKHSLKVVANTFLEQINELYRHLGRQKAKETNV